jgi:hypothetical protein
LRALPAKGECEDKLKQENTMLAFFNDETIKAKYLTRVRDHQKADEIIKGKYWEKGKGCAVGCTIHGSDHSAYERELGIPTWLAKLEDRIFEGLPIARAKEWPAEFLSAITPGTDLEQIKIPFLIFIVESARENFDHKKYPKQLKAIDGVLVELRKDVIDFDALKVARAAAYAAYAYAAAAAAAAAAYAAAAAAYAAAAYDAAADADAAYAAAAAAYADAAAREQAYLKFADKLLELLSAARGGSGE